MLSFVLLVYYLSSVTCSELLSRNRRAWIIESFSIEEEHPGPFPYVLDKINLDRNYLVLFDLFGEGVDEEPMGVLSIDKKTGILSVHKPVDYEKRTMLKLRLEVRKQTDYSLDTKLGVEISIKDINDNPPLFPRPLYEITVDEDAKQGSHVMTVVAIDKDKGGTRNSTFDYTIKSMSPNTQNTKFVVDEHGVISFKGCLDYEEAEKFTVVVEAKDRGEVIRLSSSTTVVINVQDRNNHLPVISGWTGFGTVEEDKTGTSPMRLHVTDKDTPHSPAWKAKYTIQGDKGGYFKIETDPATNDGILTVVKPLDHEEGAERHLSISVENEIPYFSCKVKERMTTGALWIVETSTAGQPGAPQPHSEKIVIHVEDTNDPPAFTVTIKEATMEENVPVGTWVEKVTAVDPDPEARDFVYKIGHDPAGWVTIDPLTGDITTVQIPDRESPHVTNGVYTILVYAVDDGEPSMTGTATLNIHVTDQNDNLPTPTELTLGVCISDDPTATNITAYDLDDAPYGGPFLFELLGDVQGKWKLDPSYGYTAGLVMEPGVFAGEHTIQLRISDSQGTSGAYNLSVTACDCLLTPNCHSRSVTATKADPGAIGIVLLSLFLLLFLLLLAFTISCKKEFTHLQGGDYSGESLLVSNTERPGTDCKIPNSVSAVPTDKQHHTPSDWPGQRDGMLIRRVSTKEKNSEGQNIRDKYSQDYRREKLSYLLWEHWNQTTRNSLTQGYHDTHQTGNRSMINHRYRRNYVTDATFLSLLHRKISSVHETEDDLLDYGPRVYADEGDLDKLSELEELTLCDDGSYQEALNDLGPAFYELASICMPPKIQN